jgi:hypothetical protein
MFSHFWLELNTYKNVVIIIFCANIQQNSLVRRVCKQSFPEIHEVNLRTLRKGNIITFRKQLGTNQLLFPLLKYMINIS